MAKPSSLGTAIAAVVATLLILIAAGLIVVYTGAYNVAASDGHAPITRWAFDTTMKNSIRARADGLTPPEFTPAGLREGAHEFQEYCVHCHGGPGVKPHEWASGMLPNPPELSHAAEEWSTAEIFWIVKHGIKMSGMPPFGEGHSDRTVWNIAGFVERLPAMTPEQYRALTGSSDESQSGHTH